jgi:hypothetical protein
MISLVVATGIVLVLVTALLQVIVFQYGKGAVRAALDEAARSAVRSPTSVTTCYERAANVLDDLLGGDMGDGVEVSCTDDADRVTVTASIHFEGWFGALTDYNSTLSASAAKEDR